MKKSHGLSGLLCAASGSMAVGDAYAAPAPAGSPVSTGSLGDLSAGITIGDVTIDPNPDQGTSVELSSADPAAGETITVTGSGFTADQRLTVAQTVARPVTGFPLVSAGARTLTTDGSGSFSTTLRVAGNVGGTDCTAGTCYIATFVALPRGVANRSQDNWTAIRVGGSPSARRPVADDPGQRTNPATPSTGSPAQDDRTTPNRTGQTQNTQTPNTHTENDPAPNPAPRPAPVNRAGGPVVTLSKTSGLNPNEIDVHVSCEVGDKAHGDRVRGQLIQSGYHVKID